MARKSFKDLAPAFSAKATPVFSACAKGTGDIVGLIPAPLSPIAPAIKPFERGEAIWTDTEAEPADSPAMVTLDASPPKAAMFFFTHCKAKFWSKYP